MKITLIAKLLHLFMLRVYANMYYKCEECSYFSVEFCCITFFSVLFLLTSLFSYVVSLVISKAYQTPPSFVVFDISIILTVIYFLKFFFYSFLVSKFLKKMDHCSFKEQDIIYQENLRLSLKIKEKIKSKKVTNKKL